MSPRAFTARFRWPLIIGAVLVLAVGGYLYWRHSTLYPSTDDAYVQAHVVHVAAQVSGPVARIFVRDQQPVSAGQTLFTIDPQPFALAVAQANAQLAMAQQNVHADLATVHAAQAEVTDQLVALKNVRDNARRLSNLHREGFVSAQAYDNAQAAVKAAEAQVNVARAKLRQAQAMLGKTGSRNERIREAQATLARAQLDLQHTTVSATCTGHIADLSLRPGDVVTAQSPLFAVVCDQEYWVNANFKETQLARIRSGQPATIAVDMYGGREFRGRVQDISPASGAAFSLLPPQNATGNWVKVTQRVPVRVLVVNPDPNFPLRVGTSAVVTVDTTAPGTRVATRH